MFWSCLQSTWRLHREEVFAELVATLSTMGIDPELAGSIDAALSLLRRNGAEEPAHDDDEAERGEEG